MTNGITIVGVGGAGTYLAGQFKAVTGYPAIAVNTDKRSLEKSELTEGLLIGQTALHKSVLATPLLGQRAAEESQTNLVQMMHGIKTLILVTGLGGATGTGAAPVIAKLACDRGIQVIAAVTLPFAFETSRRNNAVNGLAGLKSTGATVFVHDYAEDENAVTQASLSMEAGFKCAADALCKAVIKELAGKELTTTESSEA